MTGSINKMLYNHFKEGMGASGYLRSCIPGLASELKDFFNCRSDIQRIQKAETLAEQILKLTDFGEFVSIRSAVATIEIRRRISYKKQSDHTAHTLYLFLLGIWVYDNLPTIKDKIDQFICSKNPMHMFLLQWTYASLLHDVGYLFSQEDDKNEIDKTSFESFDNLFDFEHIRDSSGGLTAEGMLKLKSLWDSFVSKYSQYIHSNGETKSQVIENLDHIPWLSDLDIETNSGLELLNDSSLCPIHLKEYAFKMANEGYSGVTVIDHGIASGLMLLKYTSIWYWICKESEKLNNGLYEELTRDFKYPLAVFTKHVIKACRVVAYHNLNVSEFRFSQSNPLLYLSVLCDELQVWDRFLSGQEHIENWSTLNHCMAEDILAERTNNILGNPMLHLTCAEVFSNKIISTLDKRLEAWREYVQISVI
ncbi:hypothetical protein [Paenibacillus tepidiphilus]|uniref:hypothetical protein n=1 Tax=Paenibacillus tepidiphilus TaxID=2608683 RepID=UPI001238834B|nr:hypothetical protein [Paenibacillus tepidiphilus]